MSIGDASLITVPVSSSLEPVLETISYGLAAIMSSTNVLLRVFSLCLNSDGTNGSAC